MRGLNKSRNSLDLELVSHETTLRTCGIYMCDRSYGSHTYCKRQFSRDSLIRYFYLDLPLPVIQLNNILVGLVSFRAYLAYCSCTMYVVAGKGVAFKKKKAGRGFAHIEKLKRNLISNIQVKRKRKKKKIHCPTTLPLYEYE